MTNKRVATLLAVLLLTGGARSSPALEPEQPRLTAHAERKAERLLSERLNCLGCHRLGDEGGRIAPDLLHVRERRSEDFVRRMISDPQGTVPGTMMPLTRLPRETRELLVVYLTRHTRTPGGERAGDWTRGGSTIDAAGDRGGDDGDRRVSAIAAAGDRGSGVYSHYCSTCHGDQGRGNGVNAVYLNPPPSNLADPEAMARRSDDSLFDAIASGGRAFGVNHRMPAWGATLKAADIRLLVTHLRKLCACEGPVWSRDGR